VRPSEHVFKVLLLHESREARGGLAAGLIVGLGPTLGAVVRHLLALVLLDLGRLDETHLVINAADLILRPHDSRAALLRARVVPLVSVALPLHSLVALYLLQVLLTDEHEVLRLRLSRT